MRDLVDIFNSPPKFEYWESEEYNHEKPPNTIIHESDLLSGFEVESSAELSDDEIINFMLEE